MALRYFSIIFGLAFLFLGVMGYMPFFVQDGHLFGLLEANSLLNAVHIVTGLIALLASTEAAYAKLYLQIIGIIYALLAAIGFWQAGDLMVMHASRPDNLLHAVFAFIALLVGFLSRPREIAEKSSV